MSDKKPSPQMQKNPNTDEKPASAKKPPENIKAPEDEKGGFKDSNLPEPTRFGDWEVKGRCSDF